MRATHKLRCEAGGQLPQQLYPDTIAHSQAHSQTTSHQLVLQQPRGVLPDGILFELKFRLRTRFWHCGMTVHQVSMLTTIWQDKWLHV
jgi:hypothetical protein